MRLAVTTARGYSFGSSRSALPNKRLKLAGPALRGTNVCALASSYRRAGRLRPPALAPQLKRDPLGSAARIDCMHSTYARLTTVQSPLRIPEGVSARALRTRTLWHACAECCTAGDLTGS